MFDGSVSRPPRKTVAAMFTARHFGVPLVLAGGTPPPIYGPNREEMAKMRERMAAKV